MNNSIFPDFADISSIGESFQSIFPTWPTLVATVLAFLILLGVLTYLVYKPVKKMYKGRQKYIQDNIDASEKQAVESEKYLQEAHANLQASHQKAHNIIEDAKIAAGKVKEIELVKTKDIAKQLLKDAKQEINKKHLDFADESRKYIIDLALEAAEKIIEKEVNLKINEKLVSDFIKDKD